MTCPPCTHDCREGRDCPTRNKQELVKIVQYNCTCGRTMKFESENGIVAPQRTWIGLTADEYAELAEEYGPFPINQIEAKLKDRNK